VGILCVSFAVWQLTVHDYQSDKRENSEIGEITWLLPGQMRQLGGKMTYIIPRRKITFETHVVYPTEIDTGTGFQILLSSAVSETEPGSRNEQAPRSELPSPDDNETRYHVFELELPGLEFSPKGPNKLSVDDYVRWQVAPPREPGVYMGYIRPKPGGTADLLGAEYAVRWARPGDFELRIEVKKSFRFLDNLESLVIGLLGSVLTFPALFSLYKYIASKGSRESSTS
jgi:hypothetical protein